MISENLGIVSSAASLVGSCIMFIMLVSKLKGAATTTISHQIMINMSISNILSAAAGVVGYPKESNSFVCYWQAIVDNFADISFLAWNVTFLIMVHHILDDNSRVIPKYRLYPICWLLPILVSLLPLIELNVAREEDLPSCWYSDRDGEISHSRLLIWEVFAYYLWLLFLFAFAVSLIAYCRFTVVSKLVGPSRILIHRSIRKVLYYPMVSFAFIVITPIMDLLNVEKTDNNAMEIVYIVTNFRGLIIFLLYYLVIHHHATKIVPQSNSITLPNKQKRSTLEPVVVATSPADDQDTTRRKFNNNEEENDSDDNHRESDLSSVDHEFAEIISGKQDHIDDNQVKINRIMANLMGIFSYENVVL